MKPRYGLCIVFSLACACSGEKDKQTHLAQSNALVADLQPSGGFLSEWLLCGTFPSPPTGNPAAPSSGLNQDFFAADGGEAKLRPIEGDEQQRPNGTKVSWVRHTLKGNERAVNLEKLMRTSGPPENIVAYAYSSFRAKQPGEAYLSLGSDDGVRVWLNGKLVHESLVGRSFIYNQDTVKVTLSAGINRLLLKVAQVRGPWIFALSVGSKRQAYPEPIDGERFLLYGKKHYSRFREEILIRYYFKDRKAGVFLDVGSGHYKDESNTYFLEKDLDWTGVGVDALAEFASNYKRYRPKTQFFAYMVSDRNSKDETFYRSHNWLVSSASEDEVKRHGKFKKLHVPSITLNTLLDQHKIKRIDFLNMDIELGEPAALAGFEIDRFKPALVCIEAHPPVQKQITEYFKQHHYQRIDAYLRYDHLNWYFKPME